MLTQSPPRNLRQLFAFLFDNPQVQILNPDGTRDWAEFRGFEDGRIWFQVGETPIPLSVYAQEYPGYGMPAEPSFQFHKKYFLFTKAGVEMKVIYN